MARRACIFIFALAIAVCQPSPPRLRSPAAERKATFRAARAAYEADHPGAAEARLSREAAAAAASRAARTAANPGRQAPTRAAGGADAASDHNAEAAT
jgi:hypothetical protein